MDEKYCGTQTLKREAKSNRVFIQLMAVPDDLNQTQITFTVSYTKKCGRQFVIDSGEFLSPNYPESYYANILCKWIITVEEGYQVALTFQSLDVSNLKLFTLQIIA